MPNNFRKFSEQIYAGGIPSAKDLDYLRNILDVKTIISLDEMSANKIHKDVLNLKMKHISIPIDPNRGNSDNINYLRRNIISLFRNQPLYIHCFAGQDRTGFVLAMYRILKDNWDCKRAISEARRYGYGRGISMSVQKSWFNFLCGLNKDSNNNVDYLLDSRNYDGLNNTYPMINQQPSLFALTEDPEAKINNEKNIQLFDEYPKDVPLSGMNGNIGPTRGAGPFENSGILSDYYVDVKDAYD